MQTIKIRDKDYVTVAERLKFLRESFPGYQLTTEIITFTEDTVAMRAVITSDLGLVVADGIAHEDKSDGPINKTSYWENCQTSAWGRAIYNFLAQHFGDAIASEQEIATAQIGQITKLLPLASIPDDHRKYIEENMGSLSMERADGIIKHLYANQLDPIESGATYSQGDIHKRLDKIDKDERK